MLLQVERLEGPIFSYSPNMTTPRRSLFDHRICADGASYHPEAREWEALPKDHGLEGRARHAAVWTGEHMLIWGGESFDEAGRRTYFADGAAIGAESCVQQ